MARKKFGDPLSAGTRTAGTVQGSNGRKGTIRTTTDVLDPDTLRDLLGNKKEIYSFGAGVLGQNNDKSYENQLMSLLTQLNDLGGNISPEMQKQIYEMLLTLYQAREQRAYDENALKEQRLYDSPISQMFRLMSAGMSRDAALQALAGGSDPALVGSGADAQAPQAYGPTDIRAQQLQAAQTAISGLSAIGSLVSMGFSIPQAIQQTDLLKAQNFLTNDQIEKYNAVNQVTSAINSVVSAGGDAATAIKGMTDANQVRDYINENKDNPHFAPLFANGAFQNTFGSTVGREFFNNAHFQSVRGDTEGQQIYNRVLKEEFDKSIAGYTAGKLQKEFEILVDTFDEQITLIEQQVRNGEMVISINGEELKLKETAAWQAQQEKSITEEFFNTEIDGKQVKHHIAANSALELYGQFCMNQVKYGNEEARKRFKATCEADANFAYSMAFIKQYMAGDIQVDAEDKDTLTEIGLKLSTSGLMNAISLSDGAGAVSGVVSAGAKVLDLVL